MNPVHQPDYLEESTLEDGKRMSSRVNETSLRSGDGTPHFAAELEAESTLDTRKGFAIDRNGRLNNYSITPRPYLQEEPRFGFTRFAEIWNGRLAMIGFAASILTELITGRSMLAYWLGLG